MEALTLEPQTEERLLIYSNDQEINRITQEALTRLGILTRIFQHKIKFHQISGITNTPFDIGKFVFELQLQENSKLKELHDAGIKNAEAELPEHLQRLKDDLTSWHAYKGIHNNKFAFLKVEETSAEIDSEQLEKHFVQRQFKVYVQGEKLAEFREIEMICAYFEKNKMPSNQIRESSFLWSRIEPVGSKKYKPRWQWFRERN